MRLVQSKPPFSTAVARPTAPQHHREMAPGRIADVALEHADGVRNLLRSAPVVVDERR